jgi:hypothetical protein
LAVTVGAQQQVMSIIGFLHITSFTSTRLLLSEFAWISPKPAVSRTKTGRDDKVIELSNAGWRRSGPADLSLPVAVAILKSWHERDTARLLDRLGNRFFHFGKNLSSRLANNMLDDGAGK